MHIGLRVEFHELSDMNLEAIKFDENRGANRDTTERKIGPSGGGGATLGDVLAAKLGGLVSPSEDEGSSDTEEEES